MGGPGDPPDGTPDGAPGGGGASEDEYRSVVFDESFVRAARLQEFSADERIDDHTPAVRRTPTLRRGLTRQAVLLVVLVLLAFGTALYMGVRSPYRSAPLAARHVDPLRMTVIPLAPTGPVPGADGAGELFAHSPAASFATAADGIDEPRDTHGTAHFSDGQVRTALDLAKQYLVASMLDPDVLTGGAVRPVRALVDPQQLPQFDRSLAHPAADGRYAATGWLLRFDPGQVRLAGSGIRVHGTLDVDETDANSLDVLSDHTFVYALRPAHGDRDARVSLFTVRRAVHFRFDRDDLRGRTAELLASTVQAGPLACATDSSARLHPLLAGQRAGHSGEQDRPAGTDPYATGGPAALCGALAPSAQPSLKP
ncbi:hypothetical protein ACFW9D_34405 [Streptomyces sp. NPDC059524]|uniref:SCO2583 family membrane protein n=1 Tax=Streptomyces sp. NPDC059524 TaxID=3346856 RepID=UPI0036A59F84